MKVIAFVNQKGGVAKTTTALNVGAGLARHGYKVLLIDTDPQGSLTKALAVDTRENEKTLFEVMTGKVDALESILHINGGYDLIPGDTRLANIKEGTNHLKTAIASIKRQNDYILIDSSPYIGVTTVNAMVACNEIYVPMKPDYLCVMGLNQLMQAVRMVRRIHPQLKVTGVIMTMYNGRRRLANAIEEDLRNHYGKELFATRIRENVALAEAPTAGQDVFEYSPRSNGAKDYGALVKEIIERNERK
jgi:chromosome partitioning protein